MTHLTRTIAACGLLAAAALPLPASAQKVAPTDPTGQAAPAGAAVAPPQGTTDDGGRRPPTDPTGKTAPPGSAVAPTRLSEPNAAPSPPSTNKP